MTSYSVYNDEDEIRNSKISFGDNVKRELLHLKLLLKKNLLVSIRSYFSTGIEILSPVAFIIILFLIAHFGAGNDNPITTYNQELPICKPYGENRCFNIMFSPSDSPSAIAIMEMLAELNNVSIYNYPTDTGYLPDLNHTIGLNNGLIMMNSLDDTFEFVLAHPNVTISAVDFTSIPSNFEVNGQIPKDPLRSLNGNSLEYNVVVNTTCPNILVTCPDYSITITSVIENAIINYYSLKIRNETNITPPTITYGSNAFPKYPPEQGAARVWGGLFYYCGSMITFIFLLYKVSFEKENKLKQGMIMMGLSGPMYWVSWFITSFTIDILISLITIIVGLACQLPFFLGTNFFVLFITFSLFTISMSSVAFFLLTFIQSTKSAIGIGMGIFIVGSIFQLVFSGMGTMIFQLIYQTNSKGALAARVILFFIPMFHFTKVLTDIGNVTTNYPVTHYSMSDLSTNLNLAESVLKTVVPTTGQSICYLLALIGIYTALAWYFEHIIPGNDGSSSPPWFFALPSYWGLSLKKVHHIETPHFDDDDVRSTITKAHDQSNSAPLIIRGLSKSYTKLFRPSKTVHAVKYLSLSVEKGTILGFLGSNGCGKSTTIGMLTGLLEPTAGDALIYGHSVVSSIAAVRKVTSVVPQHDILWAEMSAREHLQLFSELKGIPAHERESQIQKVLDQVRLAKISNNLISTYSGGMKRRLSCAIACIGDPKIIFMDEPTTGVDPSSKRKLIDLVKSIKDDKVIILTSHDLSEVEILADKIVIMNEGVMACSGNSLQLKSKYGEGYSVNIVAKSPESISEVIEIVTRSIPGCKFMKQSALQLNFGFPATTDHQIIANFFKQLEEISRDPNNPLMRDWSVSHSTLDDVFLKVSHLAKLKTQ
ncbi:hypothetical protein RB653_005290 [Dictyostelium firmibasis]|uniref:ABC transporter domain-containing protein n=1 Tax=Dictyostelium firmibasis TaxID=79012 RepID=A0AAN7U7G7_9MYCE